MMYREGLYEFDFKNAKCEKFDQEGNTVHGLSAVDFVVETNTHILFIEVKDFDALKNKIQITNDNAKKARLIRNDKDESKKSLNKLKLKADKSNRELYNLFREELCRKFKDSILRKYVSGYKFKKPVRYIVVMEFELFSMEERNVLKENIFSHIPKFTEIKSRKIKIENFEILNVKQFSKKYEFSVYPTNLTNEKS